MSDSLLRLYLDPAEIDVSGYPFAWGRELGIIRIPDFVRMQAGHRCVRCLHPYVVGETPGEWSTCDDRCRHRGPLRWRFSGEDWEYEQERWPIMDSADAIVEAQWRILTVHHLNGVKHDCRWWNLVALCQRCHLTIQGKVHMARPWTREHSDWFRPYAAGFYAAEFLGEDLTREQTVARLDELLDLARSSLALFPDVDRSY